MGNTHVGVYNVPRTGKDAQKPKQRRADISMNQPSPMRMPQKPDFVSRPINTARIHEIISKLNSTNNGRFGGSPTFGGLPSSDEIIRANLGCLPTRDYGKTSGPCTCPEKFDCSSANEFSGSKLGFRKRVITTCPGSHVTPSNFTNYSSSAYSSTSWSNGRRVLSSACPTFGGIPSSDEIINTNLRRLPEWKDSGKPEPPIGQIESVGGGPTLTGFNDANYPYTPNSAVTHAATLEIPEETRNPGNVYLLKSEFHDYLKRQSSLSGLQLERNGQPEEGARKSRPRSRPYNDVFPYLESATSSNNNRCSLPPTPPPPPPKPKTSKICRSFSK